MSCIMLTRKPIPKMCLRPQGRELQRSKPFREGGPKDIPKSLVVF